ncbi:glycosyl hydrolase family 76, partial [Colletotrichum incanum]
LVASRCPLGYHDGLLPLHRRRNLQRRGHASPHSHRQHRPQLRLHAAGTRVRGGQRRPRLLGLCRHGRCRARLSPDQQQRTPLAHDGPQHFQLARHALEHDALRRRPPVADLRKQPQRPQLQELGQQRRLLPARREAGRRHGRRDVRRLGQSRLGLVRQRGLHRQGSQSLRRRRRPRQLQQDELPILYLLYRHLSLWRRRHGQPHRGRALEGTYEEDAGDGAVELLLSRREQHKHHVRARLRDGQYVQYGHEDIQGLPVPLPLAIGRRHARAPPPGQGNPGPVCPRCGQRVRGYTDECDVWSKVVRGRERRQPRSRPDHERARDHPRSCRQSVVGIGFVRPSKLRASPSCPAFVAPLASCCYARRTTWILAVRQWGTIIRPYTDSLRKRNDTNSDVSPTVNTSVPVENSTVMNPQDNGAIHVGWVEASTFGAILLFWILGLT